MIAHGGLTGVSEGAGEASGMLQGAADQAHQQDLSKVAHGSTVPPIGSTKAAGYDLAARGMKTLSGATSPESQAIGAGLAIAPEFVGPALATHGAIGTIKAGEDIHKHGLTPENTEQGLGSLAETVGGATATAHGFQGGIKGTNTAKAIESLQGTPVDQGVKAYQKIIAPSGTKAIEQMDDAETVKRAAPYLGEQHNASVVNAQQPAGTPRAGERLGVMNYAQNAEAAADKLWTKTVAPLQKAYGAAPIDSAKVSANIRGTVDPAGPPNQSKSNAIHALADHYNKPNTVKGALDMIEALNGDKQVATYEKALPDKQAEMLRADPAIEGKVKAVNSLREAVFDSIKKYGSPEEAQYIQEARKDFGALKQVSKNLHNANVPTAGSFFDKLVNTIKATAQRNPGTLQTIFNDPNKLAATSSQAFGEAKLPVRQAPPIRTTPWGARSNTPGPFELNRGQGIGAIQGPGGLWTKGSHWTPEAVKPLWPTPAGPARPAAGVNLHSELPTVTENMRAANRPAPMTPPRVAGERISAARETNPQALGDSGQAGTRFAPHGLLTGPVHGAPIPKVGNLPPIGFPARMGMWEGIPSPQEAGPAWEPRGPSIPTVQPSPGARGARPPGPLEGPLRPPLDFPPPKAAEEIAAVEPEIKAREGRQAASRGKAMRDAADAFENAPGPKPMVRPTNVGPPGSMADRFDRPGAAPVAEMTKPNVQMKGGINPAGYEASLKPVSGAQKAQALRTESSEIQDRMRKSQLSDEEKAQGERRLRENEEAIKEFDAEGQQTPGYKIEKAGGVTWAVDPNGVRVSIKEGTPPAQIQQMLSDQVRQRAELRKSLFG